MKPQKATPATISKMVSDLKRGSDNALGSYLYRGMHVQVSKYHLSTSERVAQLYHRRRGMGKCIQCGASVSRRNPATKKLYRLCDYHRSRIDRKKAAKKARRR